MAQSRKGSLKSQSATPIALFLGDAHLDTGAWANRPNLAGDSMASFRHIVDRAIKLGVQAVIGAGDLIDVKKPPPEVVLFVREQMDRLREAGIAFYFTQGQHEYSPDTPWFSAIHQHPTWLNHRTIELGGINIFGLDWHTADKLNEAISMIPADTDVVVMHQVWEEFMGTYCICEGSLTSIPYARWVFTGDFHQNRELEIMGADGQDLTVISPGSTNIRKIDEPTDKFYYVLREDRTWSRYQIPTRRKFELTIANEKDLGNFQSTFDKHISEASDVAASAELMLPLCRVEYLDTLPDVYNAIKRATAGRCELFLKPRSERIDGVRIDKADFDRLTADGGGLTSYLELAVPKTDKRYQLLLRLLDGKADPKLELQRMKKERGLVGS